LLRQRLCCTCMIVEDQNLAATVRAGLLTVDLQEFLAAVQNNCKFHGLLLQLQVLMRHTRVVSEDEYLAVARGLLAVYFLECLTAVPDNYEFREQVLRPQVPTHHTHVVAGGEYEAVRERLLAVYFLEFLTAVQENFEFHEQVPQVPTQRRWSHGYERALKCGIA